MLGKVVFENGGVNMEAILTGEGWQCEGDPVVGPISIIYVLLRNTRRRRLAATAQARSYRRPRSSTGNPYSKPTTRNNPNQPITKPRPNEGQPDAGGDSGN